MDSSAVDLEVVHETHYAYSAPVTLAHHLAYLWPHEDEAQALLACRIEIEPPPAQRDETTDAFGNRALHFGLVQPHDLLRVTATSRVRVRARHAALEPAAAPAWEAVRDRLRYVARAPYDPAVEFVQPSPYVPRLQELRAFAAPSFPPGRPLAESAIDLMRRVHAGFRYHGEATQVDTPLAQAFAQREGVCQDFAHVAIGALRMLGLPARYVSGYLLTHAAADGHALLGADASHAWIEVWAPGTPGGGDGWIGLDPTNDCVVGADHVRVAVGRDYGDVTPLRGVIRGGGRHTLSVAVRTRRVDAARELQEEAP
jgi:transglutaminase-like putative cysteine protease